MLPLDFAKLTSLELICAHLQTTPDALRSFLATPEAYYNPMPQKKRRGRRPRVVFEIEAPLKRLHRVLAVALEPHVRALPKYVQGFRPRHGIRTNAKRHAKADVVVTADIHGFFDNVRVESVIALFERLGAPTQAAILLGRLTTYRGSLPQGGRASPAISNLAVRALDRRLLKLAPECRYSRYADDLTFSGKDEHCPTESQLDDALQAHGFRLRADTYKRQPRKSGQIVTGLSLAHKKPSLTRRRRRAIERALYFGARYGLSSHMKRAHPNKSVEHPLASLEGTIHATGGIDRALYRRWLRLLERVTS